MGATEPLGFAGRAHLCVANRDTTDSAGRLRAVWSCLQTTPETRDCLEDRVRVAAAVLRLAFRTMCRGYAAHQRSDSPHRDRERACDALTFLRASYRRPDLALQHAARHVGVSRYHLSRLLRKETGYPFPTHVCGMRVLTASLLLRSLPLSVKEVAGTVGFERASELDRQFRRWIRMTPSTFRVTVRSQPACWACASPADGPAALCKSPGRIHQGRGPDIPPPQHNSAVSRSGNREECKVPARPRRSRARSQRPAGWRLIDCD
jgi:AraC-like DNA-binding protein